MALRLTLIVSTVLVKHINGDSPPCKQLRRWKPFETNHLYQPVFSLALND
jgi:hypothetical protein